VGRRSRTPGELEPTWTQSPSGPWETGRKSRYSCRCGIIGGVLPLSLGIAAQQDSGIVSDSLGHHLRLHSASGPINDDDLIILLSASPEFPINLQASSGGA
jgi:hypothetical protein